MWKISATTIHRVVLGALVTGSLAAPCVLGQAAQGQSKDAVPPSKPASASTPYRNQPDRIANREALYYEAVWGIAEPSVKVAESGVLIRFTYRVLDPAKAKVLEDKKLAPELQSPERGVKLVVPTMEKVGQLRQAPRELEAGKSYWMAFSNSGRIIKPGDRVDIVIGNFHARNLLVE